LAGCSSAEQVGIYLFLKCLTLFNLFITDKKTHVMSNKDSLEEKSALIKKKQQNKTLYQTKIIFISSTKFVFILFSLPTCLPFVIQTKDKAK